MLRWAVTEAIQRQPAGTKPQQVKDAIIARRGAQPAALPRPPPPAATSSQPLKIAVEAKAASH